MTLISTGSLTYGQTGEVVSIDVVVRWDDPTLCCYETREKRSKKEGGFGKGLFVVVCRLLDW